VQSGRKKKNKAAKGFGAQTMARKKGEKHDPLGTNDNARPNATVEMD